eukprot:403339457
MTCLEFLFREKKFKLCLEYGTIWLKRYKKLKGNSNENTLKLYGLIGELLLNINHSPDEEKKAIVYLTRFSNLSPDSRLKTLLILQENGLNKEAINFMPQSFDFLEGMQPLLLQFIFYCMFRKGQYDTRQVRDVGRYQLFQAFEENKKLLYRICKRENVFLLFVRYLSFVERNASGELVFSQTKFQYPHVKGIDMKLSLLNEKIKEHKLIIQ